ncbi:NAC domain-containing protein 83-like [Senna tora]|uniref:NAC domain-containing protein 83-like n=1 Tax=Senna tora TaxID=362788 RepID=A0A834WYX8_9FABA|nr:NAC domain-containing protein 83-like [Senna tora]
MGPHCCSLGLQEWEKLPLLGEQFLYPVLKTSSLVRMRWNSNLLERRMAGGKRKSRIKLKRKGCNGKLSNGRKVERLEDETKPNFIDFTVGYGSDHGLLNL